MADRKITDLTALAAGSQATGDLLTIVDVSEAAATDKNKKITVESLFKGIPSNVGIGTSSPDGTLHVHSASAGSVTANANADNLVVENNGVGGISILTPDASTGTLFFGSPSDNVGAALRWNHTSNEFAIGPDKSGAHFRFNSGDGSERMRIDSSGQVILNNSASSGDATVLRITGGTSGSSIIEMGDTADTDVGQIAYYQSSNAMAFRVNASEALRIDSSGRLLAGTSSSSGNFRAVFQGNSGNNAAGGDVVLARGAATPANEQALGLLGFSDSTHTASGVIQCKRNGGTWSSSSKPTLMAFQTCADGSTTPTERMRISQDGQVRIEKTGYQFFLKQSSGDYGWVQSADQSDGSFRVFRHETGTNTERMRITNQGNALFNSTALGFANRRSVDIQTSSTGLIAIQHLNTEVSGAAYVWFVYNGGAIGSITQNGTTAIAYNTTSDYRLKENVTAVTESITRLQQLKPCKFNFIADPDRTVDGFLAHEVQDIVPEAITGEKDAVDEDGNPIYQGIDQSKLVPLLTAALQEAIAKIETLETKVAALEAQ